MTVDVKSRCRGAIWGQLLGDSIALGTHWYYDLTQLKKAFQKIQGFETPQPGHYHAGKVSGDSTHYGEGCRLLLQSIAEHKGFDVADFSKRFRSFFGSPLHRGYIDHATRLTLENMKNNIRPTGADDDEMATASRLAPLVVFYRDSQDLQQKVKEATIMGQNNPKALVYMECNAKILVDLLHGQNLRETIEKRASDPIVGQRITAALQLKNLSPIDAVRSLGQTCHLDDAFPSCIYIALYHQGDFEKSLLSNVEAGGDNAGRGALLGSWLGACNGFEAIPQHWLLQLRAREQVAYWIEEII